jgi:hypothetical protein
MAIGTHPLMRRALLSVAKATLIAAAAAAVAQLLAIPNSLAGLSIALTVVSLVWLSLELAFSRADLRRIAELARPLLRRRPA